MAKRGNKYIVICKINIFITIGNEKILILKKGDLYNCILTDNDYCIYGDEFSHHVTKQDFIKYFKIHKKGHWILKNNF